MSVRASDFGDITVLEIQDESLLVWSGSYLASSAGIEVDTKWSGARGQLLGQIAWWAIVLFVGALALGQTGISQQIVNMAFTLALGAIAVAAALAFGLGGREVAGRELESFVKSFKEEGKE